MLRARRRATLGALGFIVLFGVSQIGNGQGGQPAPGGSGNSALNSSVKITEDSNLRRVVTAARECIAEESWLQAVQALQAILNQKQDSYVQVREPDPFDSKKSVTRWTSVKFEANNLIGSMAKSGLETYEQTYGADAKVMLDEAKKNGDYDLLKDIAQRFCHTKAGIEANELVATLALARGQVFSAALRFEKLLVMNPDWVKLNDLTLFKAAIAFRRAGDTKNYDEVWKRLQALPGVKVGEDMVPIAKLEDVIKETPEVDIINRYDWPTRGGNDRNSAQAMGSPPLLDALLWKRPLLNDKTEGLDFDDDQHIQPRILSAINGASNANIPVLPGFFPIASQGVLVYKNYRQVCALALKEMDLKDEITGHIEKYNPGDILWKTIPMNHSLAELHQHHRVKTDTWLSSYETNVPAGFNSFLYDNTVLGSLMTDNRYVYAINDFGVPPHPGAFMNNQFGVNGQLANFQLGELKAKIMMNQLQAYNLQTGKLVWELNPNGKDAQADPDFKDSHFLSLPIAVGGKLYVLNEKLILTPGGVGGFNPFGGMAMNPIPGDSELRLVCLDPNKLGDKGRPEVAEIQVFGTVVQNNRYVQDLTRRVNAIYLAYGDGVLVCPTNAGEIFGIDLLTPGRSSLVWSYPYRESPHQQIQLPGMIFNQPGFGPGIARPANPFGTTTLVSKWKSSPPVIQDGKVVFTAPDADSIHCINLRDGKPVWKRGQSKGDLYMAGVYQGRVLVVSEGSLRALDLKTGESLWRVATGDLPSGQGVASKGIYYLPLKRGEILAIDIATGKVKAHNRAASGGASPGNLIFYEGMVLSQTPTEIMAYPQLVARLNAARTESAAEPENLTKLTDLGDLLLKDGQVQSAVDTLIKVYDRKPADALGNRARERLFEALTDLANADFDKVSKEYLTLYKSLCDVPGDAKAEEIRKGKFFRLVGQGREAQGDLVTAFQMYKDFGSLPSHRNDGVASPDDPAHKIPVNVWLRGRISGMMAKASPEQREPLEAKIAEEWKLVDAKKDIDAIRSFVGMFDIPFRVGRDARIRLAETIMERNDRPAFLEAELLLQQVLSKEFRHDPLTGGRALAALAQLAEKKGTMDSMRLAAAYYRELARDFAKDAVRGTKTGSDLFNELATDKRFLPFLEEASNPWGAAKLKANELKAGTFPYLATGFAMQPAGDDTPFARDHRLILDPSDATRPTIQLRDLTTNQTRWTTTLDAVQINGHIFTHLYQQSGNQAYSPNARFRFYHGKGHLIVCQVGVKIYCLDGDTGKKLWEMLNVETIPQNGPIQVRQVMNDAEGNPDFLFWNQMNNQTFRITLGRIGSVQASYVAILGHKGLDVRDPLRGTVLWKKADVPMNSHLFGDEQYLFLAEANEGGGIGAGRTIRASDGEVLNVPDFSNVYQSRIRVLGRQILASQATAKGVTLRLYDILTGKDVWSKEFPANAVVLQAEDPNLTGVVGPGGIVTILDAATGKELLSSNVVQGRITPEDVKGLQAPLLLADAERFYLALNKPIDPTKVDGALVHNNFNNGTRCQLVNGWFLALHRHDGARMTKAAGEVAWKKGDLAWHLSQPMNNQMIVLEQFANSPILLFTSRYFENLANGGKRWTSNTHVFKKTDGTWVYDHRPTGAINGAPMYNVVMTDLKSRSINLVGYSNAVQIYIDDGKAPPPIPQVGTLGGGSAGPLANNSSPWPQQFGNVAPAPNGAMPGVRVFVPPPPPPPLKAP